MNKHRILYIHHGSGEGGAPLSLLYLIQKLPLDQYEPIVACCNPSAEKLFSSSGLPTRICRMHMFAHISSGWWPVTSPRGLALLARWLLWRYPLGEHRLKNLVRETTPDLVHLNSLTLLPYAPIIHRAGIPVVLHVREPVVPGLFGVRKSWLRYLARRSVEAIIYICNDNRKRLTGDNPLGRVIYNFVDFTKFDRNLSKDKARNELRIPLSKKLVLFPGGSVLREKGIFTLIEALARVRTEFPQIICLMPGSLQSTVPSMDGTERLWRIEGLSESLNHRIRQLDLEDIIIPSTFNNKMEKFYAASDVVTVPYIVPHFARPVIEAGAMAKPVVGSRIGGIKEVVEENLNGLLARPGDSDELALCLKSVLENEELASRLGEAGYIMAQSMFSADRNAALTISVYDDILKDTLKNHR